MKDPEIISNPMNIFIRITIGFVLGLLLSLGIVQFLYLQGLIKNIIWVHLVEISLLLIMTVPLMYLSIHKDLKKKRAFAQMAYHDALTDLPNRRYFMKKLDEMALKAYKNGQPFAVMIIDLDRLKVVNDTLGHAKGDLLIQLAAQRIRNSICEKGFVARNGGDEFSVILSSEENLEMVIRETAQRILNALEKPFNLNGYSFRTTGSIGISLFPKDTVNVTELLQYADMALYSVKQHGRNHFSFFHLGMKKISDERRFLENALYDALQNEEFILHYQPKLCLKTNRIVGIEALIRWNHPKLGMLMPGQFITIAEETNLIVQIGNWVLKTACKQNKLWQDMGYPPMRVAVNVSAKQFERDDFLDFIRTTLAETGLDPRWLEIEITESVLMNHDSHIFQVIEELINMGVQIAIDDFGTGYSSLSYLKYFRMDQLKIDKSFIRGIHLDKENASITRAIIQLARSLKIKVVAEGVETKEEYEFLSQNGIDEVQGYYISRPKSVIELEELLNGR
jgi:diguanylate cyclase (GGDEF)-like protein